MWSGTQYVLCCAVLRKGGRGSFLEALGVDSMYRIHCGMLPFESGQGLRLQKSTLHVICPKTTCSECLTHLFFHSFSCDFERECDRFGWWFVCVYMWVSVVLKKTKSAGESLSLFLVGTENEASGRKSGARRFTHKANGFAPQIQPLNAQLPLLVLLNSCFCEHPDGNIQYKKYLQYL